PSIYCYKVVFNEVNDKPMAVLRVDVTSESIFDAINSVEFGKLGVVFVAKTNGNLIYFNENSRKGLGNFKERVSRIAAHGGDEGSLITNVDGKDEFLVFSKKNKLGWYVIGALPQSELNEKANTIRNFIVILSVFVLLIELIIVSLFSGLISKRIIKLSHTID